MLLFARKCFEKGAKERCSENAEFNAMIASWPVSSSYHSKKSPKGCIKSIQFLRIMGTNYQNHRWFSGIANQKIIGKSTFFHKKCSFLGYLTEMLTSRDGGDGDGILKKNAYVKTRTSIHKEQQDTFHDFSSKDASFVVGTSLCEVPNFQTQFLLGKNDS